MAVINKLLTSRRFLIGCMIALFIILFSFVGPLFMDYGEYQIFYIKNGVEMTSNDFTQDGIMIHSLAKPSAKHLLGTDKEGRDILVRLMYGGRVSISVAFITMIIQGLFGTLLGGIAGYFGKLTDEVIMRFVDIVNCIPDFPVILILSAFTTKMSISPRYKVYALAIVIAFFGSMKITRVVRGQVLTIKERDYVLSATAMGISTYRKIVRHILPNVMPQIIILSVIGVGEVILTESALSFLGFGLPYPYASWGNMITVANDISILSRHVNVWAYSGILIILTVLSFNLIGDVLEDTLNPKGVGL